MPGTGGLCPKRWMCDHRDCDRCDDEAVLFYGEAAIARYLSAGRVRAAVRRLVETGRIVVHDADCPVSLPEVFGPLDWSAWCVCSQASSEDATDDWE